jgi:hypothetical protein
MHLIVVYRRSRCTRLCLLKGYVQKSLRHMTKQLKQASLRERDRRSRREGRTIGRKKQQWSGYDYEVFCRPYGENQGLPGGRNQMEKISERQTI